MVCCILAVARVAPGQQPPGSLDAGFAAGTDKTVVALAVQADGRTVIAGNFTQVNGVTNGNVARLNADGSLDASFNAATDADAYGENVSAIAVQPDGKILLGGHFTQVNGAPHGGVARLLGDGSLDPAFNASVTFRYAGRPYLSAVAVQPDGKILVAGSFDQVNGVPGNGTPYDSIYNSITRLNADGSQDLTSNAGVDGYVTGMATQPDGKILLSGAFGRVNGILHGNVARLNADGSLDAAFQVNVSGGYNPHLAALPDGRVLLGGEFTQVNGISHGNVARLNADGSLDAGFNAGVAGRVITLVVSPGDGRIVLGGSFVSVNGLTRNNVARLNADGTLDTGFFANAVGDSNVAVLALGQTADGKLLLGGRFTLVDGAAHPNVARLLGRAGTLSPPVVSGAAIVNAVVGQPFAYAITASNTPSEYGAGGLPPGLSVNRVTGTISGTPTATGRFTVNLSATNGAGTGTGTVVVSVAPAAPAPVPVVTSAASAAGQVGQPFAYQIVATGNATTYETTGLPGGLGVNPASGLISGTPTVSGGFSVTLSAANAAGTGSAPLTLTISAPPIVLPAPVVTSAPGAGGQVGQPFVYQITATNHPTAFGATGLPAGLKLDPGSGVISGVPGNAGVYPVLLSAANAGGTGSTTLTLTIVPAPARVEAPVVTGPGDLLVLLGQPCAFAITATNAPRTFAAAGLPAGLSLDAASGLVSGTPTAQGLFVVTLSAANAAGAGTASLTLSVAPVPGSPSTVSVQVDAGTISRSTGPAVATITLTRHDGDLTLPIRVAYTVGGTLIGGSDYGPPLVGTKKIKAGRTTAVIEIRPLPGGGTGKLKLTLAPGEGYTVMDPTKVKVKVTD